MAEKMDTNLEEIINFDEPQGLCPPRYPEGSPRTPRKGPRHHRINNLQREYSRDVVFRPRGGFQLGRGRGGLRRKMRVDVNPSSSRNAVPTKLMVSNLDFEVSDAALEELLCSEIGSPLYTAVHHDSVGKSLGTAVVMFETREEAIKVMNQYNGVKFIGRTMNIELISSEVPSPITENYEAEYLDVDLSLS